MRERGGMECLHRHFAARAQGCAPAPGDLAALNAALAATPPRRVLTMGPEGLTWATPAPPSWATGARPCYGRRLSC